MEILHIKNLTFYYPETESAALNDVSLSIKVGEFTVICGESGCGKSTLLKLIKKEIAPYGESVGEIHYCGTPLSEVDSLISAAEIGYVSQNPESSIVTDTVWHELAFGLEGLGLDTAVIRRRVAEMASYFGIEKLYNKKVCELSGGEKQLLNLASVMVMQPKILLLDEPTAQLDPIAAENFISTLCKLNRELGLTILLVEHRLEEVFPVCDKVLLMEAGRLGYCGTPSKITEYFKSNPAHPMLAALPAAMRIFALLESGSSSPITVREGRNFVATYNNKVPEIEPPTYTHSSDIAVELKEVRFRYQKDLPDVMKDVSLTVYSGEHFCILGGNGSGKTTTLNIIAGLLKAYCGKVKINGKRISDYKANSLYINNLSLLPQDPKTVFIGKTVLEDLRDATKAANAEPEAAINEVVELLQIKHLLLKHPYDLSGGEQQKSALAKILLLKPKILLLDEPTKAVDAYFKLTLLAVLNKLKAKGVTVITVTHDVEFAAACGDRCGLFFGGELVSVGTKTEFFCENNFYTTAANRISRGHFKNAVLCEDVARLCSINGKKAVD